LAGSGEPVPWFGSQLSPMIASAAMTFVSVSVISNTLRFATCGAMRRYTDYPMRRRVLVFAIAVVILAAPVAADVCHVTCAAREAGHSRHSGHSSNTHHDHSADATATPTQTMSAGPHLCGDTGPLLFAPQEIRQGMHSPAVISTLIVRVAPRPSAQPIELALDASPPSFLALTSQLRI